MTAALLLAAFLALWAGATLLLSRLAWFQRRPTTEERLRPYVQQDEPDWVDDVEGWLRRH
ncbi:MAG: hypothetical protein M3P53_04655 [Actinomycetota bacterium]|nr:hypothetical protein [Actinomycetota bacterium]